MRVLVVYCHPVETSFHAALHGEVVRRLREAGHEVDDCDLYAEGFDPVLSRAERLGYHEVPSNREPLRAQVERLQWAEALVLCFPTWCFGPPAMLKGFIDRLMMPGVAFDLSDPRHVRPTLDSLERIVGVVTYGRPRWMALAMQDPPRRMVTRYLRWFAARRARAEYLALYHLNVASDDRRRAFIERVRTRMERL